MKRLFSLLLTVVVALSASAQTTDGLNVFSLRVGDYLPLRNELNASMPFSLAYEHELVSDAWGFKSLIFGVGGVVGFRNYTNTQCAWGINDKTGLVEKHDDASYDFYHKYNDLLVALRIYAHYDVFGELLDYHSDQVDTYAVLTLGTAFNTFNHLDLRTGGTFFPAFDDPNASVVAAQHKASFVPGLQLGCRYWLTPNVGAFAEVGYDGFSIFNGGLQICF